MDLFGFEIDIKEDHFVIDNRIIDYLKKNLKESRFNHSYSVGILSYEIALKNKLEKPLIYFLAGLLHDVGKYVDINDSKKIMEENFREYLDLPSYAYHSFIGAKMIKEELKIENNEFLDAIMFHTTGKGNLSALGMVLFAADKIEPTRKYDSYDLILEMFKDFRSGFNKVLIEVNKFLKSKNDEDNRLSIEMYTYYLKGVNDGD